MTTLVSGSPIIQNGKLVGAVTHVLIANPTEGYGIFAMNCLRRELSIAHELSYGHDLHCGA